MSIFPFSFFSFPLFRVRARACAAFISLVSLCSFFPPKQRYARAFAHRNTRHPIAGGRLPCVGVVFMFFAPANTPIERKNRPYSPWTFRGGKRKKKRHNECLPWIKKKKRLGREATGGAGRPVHQTAGLFLSWPRRKKGNPACSGARHPPEYEKIDSAPEYTMCARKEMPSCRATYAVCVAHTEKKYKEKEAKKEMRLRAVRKSSLFLFYRAVTTLEMIRATS
nr:hypothetical protein [Pandoravirus aubagnensis]